MRSLKLKLKKLSALFKEKGPFFTLKFLFGRLVVRFTRHVVYEIFLDHDLSVSRWDDGEKLLNFGPDDLPAIRNNGGLLNFIGGDLADEYLEGMARGDRMFVVRRGEEYLYYGFVLFKTRQARIIGETGDAPLISNCFTVPSERGRGIYRRALNDKLFYLQKAGYERVVIETHPDNKASRKGVEAASFHVCRILTSCVIFYKIAVQLIKTDHGFNIRVAII